MQQIVKTRILLYMGQRLQWPTCICPFPRTLHIICTLIHTRQHNSLPAKAFSLPVMTMAPTLLSLSKLSQAALSSRTSWSHRAFSALGRCSVMSPTESPLPTFSTLIISYADGAAAVPICRRVFPFRADLARLVLAAKSSQLANHHHVYSVLRD